MTCMRWLVILGVGRARVFGYFIIWVYFTFWAIYMSGLARICSHLITSGRLGYFLYTKLSGLYDWDLHKYGVNCMTERYAKYLYPLYSCNLLPMAVAEVAFGASTEIKLIILSARCWIRVRRCRFLDASHATRFWECSLNPRQPLSDYDPTLRQIGKLWSSTTI